MVSNLYEFGLTDIPEPPNPHEQKKVCRYNDPLCPCVDGDPCHYEDHADAAGNVTKAMRPPEPDNAP